jgi:hypothetical protein
MLGNRFLRKPLLVLALLAACLLSCTVEPHGGVISTGNAGRVHVSAPFASQPQSIGDFRIIKASDSIAEIHSRCIARLDSGCSDSVTNGSYRAEVWIGGKLSGRSGWFVVKSATVEIVVVVIQPIVLQFAIQSTGTIDSVVLGTRDNAAQLVDGKWQVAQLPDSGDALWVKVTENGQSVWKKYTQTYSGKDAVVTPVSPSAPTVTSTQTVTLTPSNTPWFETTIIGSSTAIRTRDNLVYSADTIRGLGASWDPNTVGRTLWKVSLPESLGTKTIRSARLVYQTSNWGVRPVSAGTANYSVEGHRMLRSWKSGSVGYGAVNSATVDAATPQEASWGIPWNSYMVGLDGTDAEFVAIVRGTLASQSLSPMNLDITQAVKDWLRAPATNHGLIFLNSMENSTTYPDYPVFWTNTAPDTRLRPSLVIEYSR